MAPSVPAFATNFDLSENGLHNLCLATKIQKHVCSSSAYAHMSKAVPNFGLGVFGNREAMLCGGDKAN